jgi:hypothetical protein
LIHGILSALAPNQTAQGYAEFVLRRLKNGERDGGATEMEQPTAAGGDMLIVGTHPAKAAVAAGRRFGDAHRF